MEKFVNIYNYKNEYAVIRSFIIFNLIFSIVIFIIGNFTFFENMRSYYFIKNHNLEIIYISPILFYIYAVVVIKVSCKLNKDIFRG